MKDKITILVHGMTSMIGGIESFVINYFRHIHNDTIHFDFICYNRRPAYYQEIIDSGSKVYVIPGRRNYFSCCRHIKNILETNHYDVVWSNMCLLSDILILQFAKKQNVAKRIIHSHNSRNMSTLINGVLHTINKKRIEKYATDFWACSQMAAEYFYPHAVLSSDRFKIIHNAIEAERFSFNQASRNTKRKELAIDDALVLGHIGRFTSQKNHEFLLKIFSEIHIRVPNSVLLLIGDGPLYGSIKNYVHILRLADYVHFLGIREDIPELLHAMDFYIFPSIYEGLPIVLIEAQAASLYSVTSTAVSSETAITDMISFVDLKNTHKQWAELIISKTGYKRNNVYEEIQNKNYDIKTESILMEQLLLSKG